ncbi:MAG: DUF3500 domain-containing protein [Verrucomicrobiota bacterium]|nr:DUF3500 domain-containing protein [Verrucomicrobiota bacterium]|tara:strand:+ start:1803 stop:2846 length:1044 start_codon:yes stop_codon:yes gene_type:complete
MQFLRILKILTLALLLSTTSSAIAHPEQAAIDMTDAANAFLATLKPEQKAKATFKLDDKNRTRWHFVPTEMHARHGLSFREMQQDQQHMAFALLASVMSAKGLQKSAQIMSLEQILNDANPEGRFARDPKWYFLSFFGNPSTEGAWGWRFEGHHLSLSFTIIDGHVASITPSFWGTNPGKVLSGPRKGLQVLANEENYARILAQSFTKKQKDIAIISEKAPEDIITKANRKAQRLEPLGIAASKMKKKQISQLWTIIEVYLRNYRPDIADETLANLEEVDLKNIHFGWAGSLKAAEGHYYRIQAPDFLIEYDNTQGGANHVHCVIRDLKNDFGDDLLRQHYEKHHKN